MALTLSGLASGIDTSGLVDSLVGVARKPLDDLAAKKKLVDAATSTISSFSSKLAAFKNAALALSTSTGFSSAAATSTDAAVVASATGSSPSGTYGVTVSQLARAQKSRSAAQTSATTALGVAGSLRLQAGSAAAVDITVGATDTLSDIAAKISSSGARVQASVITSGSQSYLLVQGRDTGAANGFSMTETGFSLGLGTPASIYEGAQDASAVVDGLTVTSPTNQLSGVIPGVTLALTKTTTAPASVTVSSDPAAVRKKVEAFVSAYNELVNMTHSATGFGSTKATNAELAGDRSMRTSMTKLARVLGERVANTDGKYQTLASVGVAFKRDGTLAVDATKFDAALSADPSSIARLFVTDTTTGATGAMKTLMTTVDSLVSGSGSVVQSRLDGLAQRSKRMVETADRLERQVEDYRTRLAKQFIAMDQVVGRYQSLQSAVSGIASLGNNNGGNGT